MLFQQIGHYFKHICFRSELFQNLVKESKENGQEKLFWGGAKKMAKKNTFFWGGGQSYDQDLRI